MNRTNDVVLNKMKMMSKIKGELITPPQKKYTKIGEFNPDDLFIYKINKIYESDLKYINALQLNETRIGVIFQNPSRIISSIIYYNSISNTKKDFTLLEEELKNL